MNVAELPIGRRVAHWRARRRMTQQMLADRLGKSKSWVDKVERGVRALDRLTVVREVAEALRVDPAVLLGRSLPPAAEGDATTAGRHQVDAVRAALARYDFTPPGRIHQPTVPVTELRRRVGHAWLTYQHAHYPQLLRILPGLLRDVQRAHAAQPERPADLLVQVYRATSSVLVKLGQAELAWLAADRALTVAAGDPLLAAVAAIPLAQSLRALGGDRLALAVALAAGHSIAAPRPEDSTPGELSVLGTLLLQAALAAASRGDPSGVQELTDQAAGIAELVGDGHDHHWTCFGRTAVELARIAAAVELGDAAGAISRHEKITGEDQWVRLPAERRAAYLVDAARAYLQVGELAAAGRLLLDADRVAPAEIRSRPAARTVIAAVARGGPATAGVAHLASVLGIA
ncbi:helix-turn-helix domain-containing protein [Micromonospora sp. WMMD882]|uniref:helix-turn-helix domain-containing protein n=1 Tax=Micromonospora sp. WMMD882 TaxID=3015151 RepID=UPI00248D079D|nr:helix-turn-helix domain-containing protein [Micromonospora sp. WMMD882]WBB78792.1 helix-turn-helix domain-containing protein [Micromonospora sp. WMMD882]